MRRAQARPSVVRGILREPLLHFMLVGVALFVAFEWAGTDDAPPADEIRVDQAALVQFLTHRDPRLNIDSATTALGSMTRGQHDALIEEYVREEVLFRQARAMGLDSYDYVGRRRLIAQLDYINRGFIEQTMKFSDDELRAFHKANRERYLVPPKITFTHVYFGAHAHGVAAKTLASEKLAELNENAVPFHVGPSRGDLFLYHKNYVGKEAEEVASHFGADFANAVFKQAPSERWVGPFASEHGYHIVMVSSHKPGYSPSMAEVRQRVVQDLTFERTRDALDSYYREAGRDYDIVIELPEATL